MTLTKRTILIVVSTFIALLFILAATSDVILLKSFASLERTVLIDNVQKVRNEIDESYEELDAASGDLAAAVKKNGHQYVTRIDDNSFISHHIDLVICYSETGGQLSSKSVDYHNHRTSQLSENDLASIGRVLPFATHAQGGAVKGMIMVGSTPLQLVLRAGGDGKTLLLVGRFLDVEEVNRVTALTEFVVDLVPLAEAAVVADIAAALAAFERGDENPTRVIDEDLIAGYSVFKDLFGKPVVIARVSEQRLLYDQGKAAIAYVITALFLAGGVFCCVILFFIRGTILKRLESLGVTVKSISTKQDITSRLPVSDEQDELTDLAVSINAMLASLESSEKAMRESEERYRLLFERAPEAIIIVGMEGDEAGQIMAANQAAADQHGYTIEELCSMHIFEINTAESNKIAESVIGRISRGEWVTFEIWHNKKDGSQFPLEVHAGRVKINERNYMLGFDRDITVRKVAEESDRMYLDQIRQLNAELSRRALDLVAANNELESFNYSVSHDMRAPLTRISGYCQLILDDGQELDPQLRTYITRIYDANNWLNEMIDAMLSLAQLTRAEFAPERINLSSVAEEIVRELELAEPDREVLVSVMPDMVVAGDLQLLKILMTNLLNNAWKYSSHQSQPRIEFGCNQNGAHAVFFVRDNGAGFDMKDAEKLFRVFTRLHDPAQFSGTGIGLATVQRVVARHGGRVWAEGEPGKGAVFYFTLQPGPEGQDDTSLAASVAIPFRPSQSS